MREFVDLEGQIGCGLMLLEALRHLENSPSPRQINLVNFGSLLSLILIYKSLFGDLLFF